MSKVIVILIVTGFNLILSSCLCSAKEKRMITPQFFVEQLTKMEIHYVSVVRIPLENDRIGIRNFEFETHKLLKVELTELQRQSLQKCSLIYANRYRTRNHGYIIIFYDKDKKHLCSLYDKDSQGYHKYEPLKITEKEGVLNIIRQRQRFMEKNINVNS